ncbi:MAG: trypsin-like peptidase domain-containing protein [Armatimonadota bacterium]|nr:trypsin-like peptidase domain-containing protein [Armatimonadota bacterium]
MTAGVSSVVDLSRALAGIAEAVGPSVVRVEARGRLPASGIVWSPEGLVVTADHVIEDDEHIRVGLPDGAVAGATLAGRDATTDLAVLRADARGLRPAVWTDPDRARVGHLVVSLGRPGRTARAALGMLTAVAEAWRGPGGAIIDRYLQIDRRLPPGFSGGPLADGDGAVLGLTTAGLLRDAVLAIPAPTVRRVVETLLAHGRIPRGYLGIGAQPVRLPAGLRQALGQESGLLAVSVEPGSSAERAGLQLGDVLLRLGETTVRHPGDLMAMLGAERIGATLVARLLRGGTVQEVAVTVGERP